ncbi:MAG: group II intron reverse transcriptase/maturase, partial [Bacteroidales bacterium]|nr:group II intron reverse transcriptase/maturase [Bacteroidales bacterium]
MVVQLSMFDDQIKPANSHDGCTGSENCTGVELLSQLESQRTLTENLLEAVVDYGNLRNAYQRVRQNKGSAGIDEMDVDALGKWLNKNLITFRETVLAENYQPVPVRKVMIRKPDGGERMLGIPTAKDRMLQQAIHQTLSRYYDPLFSENSFGFRSGRNAHQAILQASKYISSGKEWVVDIDLEKFFDNVNHDRLMQR